MKSIPFRRRHPRATSFTLVELLVVIAIIAILASVLLEVGSSVINSAKRAKASSTAQQIQTACLSYYTEYSVYPLPSSATAGSDYAITDTQGSQWASLIDALCGNISPLTGLAVTGGTTANTRSIAFLSLKSSDVDTKNSIDAPVNPITATNTVNLYFDMAMDGDYDGILGVAPSAVTTLPKFTTAGGQTQVTVAGGGTSTAGIAVWANCNPPGSTNGAFWVHTY